MTDILMAETKAAPDFRGITYWVFDLDHTLYTMNAEQEHATEERICQFVQRHFGLPREEAWAIQKRFLLDHGTTLAGLMEKTHHPVDPDLYHDEINDLDALELKPDPALRKGLARLPGQLFVFTNNCGRFARGVLSRLGVEDLFHGVVDTKAMGFVPKPRAAAYAALLAQSGLRPERAALFDDSPRNLVPAHAMGMKTVWFNHGRGLSRMAIADPHLHIDHETDDLASFLQSIRV